MDLFHAKVGTAAAGDHADERPVGGAQLVAARLIKVPATESAVGSVRAVHEMSVASKVLAKVMAVHVKAGQQVKKGDLLVQLDDADLRARRQQASAALDAARAARDQAKIEHERVSGLFRENAAPRIEMDRATTNLKAAEADLQRAEQALKEADTVLGYTTILAPTDGVVVDKRVEAGDTALPGQVLVNLYDPRHMQLVASVRESLTHRLRVGQTIKVGIEALGNLLCDGQVSEIVPEADVTSRSFLVKVTGPCPPGAYVGMFGRLLIPLDEEELLVIPQAAVRRVGQLDSVDVAEDGFLRRRIVQLGRILGDDVQVLSGLSAGELVALPRVATRQGG
ncbi:MAG: RND transporter [Phycisphaerae bacterium]